MRYTSDVLLSIALLLFGFGKPISYALNSWFPSSIRQQRFSRKVLDYSRSSSSSDFLQSPDAITAQSPPDDLPLSRLESEFDDDVDDDEDDDNGWSDARRPYPKPFSRNDDWLEEATKTLLDHEKYPIGELSEEDVEAIAGLMAAWSRRCSVHAAISLEKLLKRVVDDMRANNSAARVNTRLYTYVSREFLALLCPFM
jgi:hypothetical protein